MLYSIVFEDYNKLLKRGVKKLESYKSGMIKLGMFFILCAIGLGFYSWMELIKIIPEGLDTTIENIGIAVNKGDNLLYCGGTALLLFLSSFSFFYHGKMVDKKIKFYIEDIHPKIIQKHKSIFVDHSEEAIKAFREERDEKELLKILKAYQGHMEFILNNYSNFDREGSVD